MRETMQSPPKVQPLVGASGLLVSMAVMYVVTQSMPAPGNSALWTQQVVPSQSRASNKPIHRAPKPPTHRAVMDSPIQPTQRGQLASTPGPTYSHIPMANSIDPSWLHDGFVWGTGSLIMMATFAGLKLLFNKNRHVESLADQNVIEYGLLQSKGRPTRKIARPLGRPARDPLGAHVLDITYGTRRVALATYLGASTEDRDATVMSSMLLGSDAFWIV